MPICASSIQNHSSATTTLATRYGISTRPRTTTERVSRCISTASRTASTVWKPMFSTTYQTVTSMAFQNVSSVSSRW
jgi:hypothetical protein